jgi:DNA-binding transcriptional ArsR family regulator
VGDPLATSINITDARLVKALAHPLRIQILALLDNRVASPKQIATELDTPLPNTAYHVRQLAALGLVELVRRTVRGGAIEHHYTTKVRPIISDDLWGELPEIVKRAAVSGAVNQALWEMARAVDSGGFSKQDVHLTRTAARLDEKGWKDMTRELHKALKGIDRVVAEANERLATDPDADTIEAMAVMALFERPQLGGQAAATPPNARNRARASRGTGRRSAS